MNLYEKAQHILDAIIAEAAVQDVALPEAQYAQLGTPVIACPLVTVATAAPLSPVEETGPTKCNASQVATFQCIIARACGWTSDSTGADDPDAIASVSAQIAADVEIMWAAASAYNGYLVKNWSVAWEISGGMSFVTLTLSTGVD